MGKSGSQGKGKAKGKGKGSGEVKRRPGLRGLDVSDAEWLLNERALIGRQAIADFIGCSCSTVDRRMPMWKRDGVVFHQKFGNAPKQTWVCAFPSMIKAWLAERTKAGLPL